MTFQRCDVCGRECAASQGTWGWWKFVDMKREALRSRDLCEECGRHIDNAIQAMVESRDKAAKVKPVPPET